MRPYDNAKPIISLHIPKCAGTSLEVVLQKWFNRKGLQRRFFQHYFDEKNNKPPKKHNLKSWPFRQTFKKDICIHGHFNNTRNFGVFDYYPEADQFFTILREPFEIEVSLYYYTRKKVIGWFEGEPNRFVDDYKDINEFLARPQSVNAYLLNYIPFELTEDNYKDIIREYFVYVGVTEDLQTSVDRLAAKLGYPSMKVEFLRVTYRDKEIDPALKQQFIDNHQLEYAIYEYALTIYDKP